MLSVDAESAADIEGRLKALAGLENPNSALQMKRWLASKGLHIDSLGRKEVVSMVSTVHDDLKEPLRLRLRLSKSSIRNYDALLATACSDGRAMGMFHFCGLHTGRWEGRYVQMQKLPQSHISDLVGIRDGVMKLDYDALVMSILDTF